MSILTWQKAGLFSSRRLLRDGERTLWELRSDGVLQGTRDGVNTGMGLACAQVDGGLNDGVITVNFTVQDARSQEALARAAFHWKLRDLVFLPVDVPKSVGTIQAKSGDPFEVVVQRSRLSRDLEIASQSPGKCLRAMGKTTVETDMNPDESLTAVVLLASIALVWRIRPFDRLGH